MGLKVDIAMIGLRTAAASGWPVAYTIGLQALCQAVGEEYSDTMRERARIAQERADREYMELCAIAAAPKLAGEE
jgi:hypothetical protein